MSRVWEETEIGRWQRQAPLSPQRHDIQAIPIWIPWGPFINESIYYSGPQFSCLPNGNTLWIWIEAKLLTIEITFQKRFKKQLLTTGLLSIFLSTVHPKNSGIAGISLSFLNFILFFNVTISHDSCFFKLFFSVKYVKLDYPDTITPRLQIIGVLVGIFFLPIFIKFSYRRYKNSSLIATDLQIYWIQTCQNKLICLSVERKQ